MELESSNILSTLNYDFQSTIMTGLMACPSFAHTTTLLTLLGLASPIMLLLSTG